MSNNDLTEFRAEMRRRGVYDKPRRIMFRAERDARKPRYTSMSQCVAAEVVADPSSMSIKRLAWAFGCAKADSETELQLYRALVDRVAAVIAARQEPLT